MILSFSSSAKELKKAVNARSCDMLKAQYPHHYEKIYQALELLLAAEDLNAVRSFSQFDPHALTGDKKDIFSMWVGGRKKLIIRTRDENGKPTKTVDFMRKTV